jgi:trypsin
MRSTGRVRGLILLLTVGLTVALAPGSAHAVVGGSTVPQGTYPFMAAVLSNGSQFCGGSVIGSQWVLTAAHCVVDGFEPGLAVSVGNVDYTQGRVVAVDGVSVHPAYNADTSANDVALLHLAAPAGVTPIALTTEGNDQYEVGGAPVVVAGWGSEIPLVGLVPPLGTTMKQATLSVVDDNTCTQDQDAASQVCAEALLKDSCQGDSGGPLFATTSTGARIQVGVVSYGQGCAIPLFPGVYSEVNGAAIRQFIRSTAGV